MSEEKRNMLSPLPSPPDSGGGLASTLFEERSADARAPPSFSSFPSAAFWTFYVAFVLFLWLCLSCAVPIGLAWTYVNLIHNATTFYFLHWKKGSPVYYDQGKYDHLTFWEQIDGGSQFTNTKKFLTVIPVVM